MVVDAGFTLQFQSTPFFLFHFLFFGSVYSAIANKADKTHTHNDNSGLIQLDCSYGNVWKFKKNGWVTVIWGNLNATSMATGSWVTLASTGWSNQAPAHNYYGNFVQADSDTCRVTVNPEGVLRCFKPSSSAKEITYGYIVYPTAD